MRGKTEGLRREVKFKKSMRNEVLGENITD